MGFAVNSAIQSRRHVPSDKAFRAAWVNECGQLKCAPAKCIDISDLRIHIEMSVKIALGTRMNLSTSGNLIPGPNVVKYITQCDTKFILVLERERTPTLRSQASATRRINQVTRPTGDVTAKSTNVPADCA